MKQIESAITAYLEQHLADDLKALAKPARQLSALFTKERFSLSNDYFADDALRSAYIAHFTLTNVAKSISCLAQIDGLKSRRSISILDIGCGTGASSLAAASFFESDDRDVKIKIDAIDRSGAILGSASEIFKACRWLSSTISTILSEVTADSIEKAIRGRTFDIVFMTNVLNELPGRDDAFRLCDLIIGKHLNDGGHIIIIDPALKTTTRSFMALRNRLLSDSPIHVLAPCLHQNECPMLAANDRDWCHFYIEWIRPALIKTMDDIVGTDHRYLKLGYLIIGKSMTKSKHDNLARIVSSPLVSKGKLELMLCTADGELRKIRRMDRDCSKSNSTMDLARRGDIVRAGTNVRLNADSDFEIVRPWTRE